MLIVEDGTGKPDADSYVDLVYAREYAAKYGYTLPDEDADLEVYLRRSTELVDLSSFSGERANDDQALDWPRKNASCNGERLDNDIVPTGVMRATVVYADALNAGVNVRANDDGRQVKLQEVVGEAKREFFEGAGGYNVNITAAMDQLKCYLGSSGLYTRRVIRA